MRIKKDRDPWNSKVGGALKKDANATKAPDTETPHRSKKNTRRWCGGREGREHEIELIPLSELWKKDIAYFDGIRVQVCRVCRKQLKWEKLARPLLGSP